MGDDAIRDARRWFAEELRLVAKVSDEKVVDAFATVPRERFLGPPHRLGIRSRTARHRAVGRVDGAAAVVLRPLGSGLCVVVHLSHAPQSHHRARIETTSALENPDLGVVADEEPVGAGLALVAPDAHVASEQR